MSDIEMNESEIGWFVSDVHCRRAIGYLGAELVTRGYLQEDFELPKLLEMWSEALEETMAMNEPSPLGPDPEAARKFLLSTIEARITQVENRNDRMENAIAALNKWMSINLTRYGPWERQEIEKILYGSETASTSRS